MKAVTAEGPARSSIYPRVVQAIVGWMTPKRRRIYPAAVVLAAVIPAAWLSYTAVRSGTPFLLTVGQDFKGYYTGGRLLVEGRTANLYDFEAQREVQEGLAIPGGGLLPFIHPPFSTLLWAPFALDGYAGGLLFWWAAGLMALATALRLLWRALPLPGIRGMGHLMLLSILFYPTLDWFLYGQNTALTLLLYALFFVLLRRGRDLEAGAALGLLLYKPQLAVAPALALLVGRRWRALLGGALTSGLWLAAGFVISPEAIQDYLRLSPRLLELELSLDVVGSKLWAVHSLYAFAVMLVGGFWPQGADLLGPLLTTAGAIAVCVVWWRTPWRPATPAWDFRFAATFALGLVISPYVFRYDLMLLLVPLAIVWSHFPQGTAGRPLDGGPLLAWTALLYGAAFASSLLSAAQLQLSAALGLPSFAIQLSVPVILGWAWVVSRRFSLTLDCPRSHPPPTAQGHPKQQIGPQ